MRRPILAIASLLIAGVCFAANEGTYKPAGGPPTSWSINDHQTLIWGGQPYLPVGIRIDGTPEAVAAAKAAGISDVIVDLPVNGSGWDAVFSALNKANMRFLLRIDSIAPMARGFAVEPQGYRVTGITRSQQISLEIPGAGSAFVVLATKGDGSIIASERVPITDGHFNYFAKIGPEIEHVLLIYPEMTSIQQPDYWESLDTERDELLGSLRKHPPGPGLRGIVNPMGRGLALNGAQPEFVPTSRYFQMEMRKFLAEKYKSVETLMKNWAMTSSNLSQSNLPQSATGLSQADLSQLNAKKRPIATFATMANLIPLWTSSRGIGAFLDPQTNVLYTCDDKRSRAWSDFSEVITAAGLRRYSRLVPDIRAVVDVPVVQDWLGWAAAYETRTPDIDGVGMRTAGTTQSALAETGCRATSSILRWSTHGWLVATDVDLGAGTDAATQISSVLDTLSSMGARGVFLRADSAAEVKAASSESKTRSSDTSLMETSPLPVFFPENAYNPAVPQKLPGDHWWLPCPSDGNRIDLGSMFFAYRSGLNDGVLAMWSRIPGRYKLRMASPRTAKFRTLTGVDPMVKEVKGGVEVSLTEVPLIITGTMEVPIPEFAYAETVERFQAMLQIASKTMHRTDEDEMSFHEGVVGFDRNPGGSFDILRKQYWKLVDQLSPYCWIEAEKSTNTNFSDVESNPGCSGGSALALRTLVPPGVNGYFAEYNLPVKTRNDQEVWIAAKIPAERRDEVSVTVGGQSMKLSGEPLSLYGGGFGWYKLGTTRIAGNTSKLRITVSDAGNSEIAIDTILITPGTFTPNGITPPDPVDFRLIQMKSPQKGKRRGSGGS